MDTRTLLARLAHRWLPDPPWAFSDDKVMGISVVETLEEQPLTAFTHLAEPPAAR